jgi:hypothetical protein
VARGPLGDLLRAVDGATLKARADLRPGTYKLRVRSQDLELWVPVETAVAADVDFRVAAAGDSPDGPWVEPEVRACRLDFSRPVRIGSGPRLAVSSVALRPGRGLTGELAPAYAESLAALLVDRLQGAGRAGAGRELGGLVAGVDVASASLRLRPGAAVSAGASRLVLGPATSAELVRFFVGRDG